ncbi:hypothetical protein CJD36_014095 [Flavipsychrobacter stenotrophus]|uniref:Type II toxin-antitoxin system RelE/ParE family toxin n=1 Tax=Flavipsychrobacter stenotrophus TaxID=2077091 RepID=A0A2S7SWY3_9BACT|nr:hypothetical protein [Flavipsychrobacter stenotrophus]PQJ11095.1 hypothetical protein CJD36_014095 [Flavipsychrobacter stenotrophus]
MAYNFIVSIEAELETISATDYYDNKSVSLGTKFLADLNASYSKLITNPQYYKYIARNRKAGLRCIKLKKFPFLVVYHVHMDNITIVSVLNTHRKSKFG